MRISRLRIENFRNFGSLDIPLAESAVIVGKNATGKSNLLHALRLLLDPSLPDSDRYLRQEDFWDGLPRPLAPDAKISIELDFTDFEDDDDLVAVLGQFLVEPEPMVARLRYVYQPIPEVGGSPKRPGDYEYAITGGPLPGQAASSEIRRRLPMFVLPALRDAVGDLASWRRSPLRPLLERAAAGLEESSLREIATTLGEACQKITRLPEIDALAEEIRKKHDDLVGPHQQLDSCLNVLPTDAGRLLRMLQLFIDGGSRSLADGSLGSANIIYLALRSLELEELAQDDERDHTVLAIEEPEAHLHPHIQRRLFRHYLRPRQHQSAAAEAKGTVEPAAATVLLTTHSTHIVSVAPLRSVVVIKKASDAKECTAHSLANIQLSPADVDDLERYIEVTRGEILFAKGVLLVEGDAESFLVPALASKLGIDLDELGISVCSVSGTNFLPYLKLLGPDGLDTPFAVLTDLDPRDGKPPYGDARLRKLLSHLRREPVEKSTRGKKLRKLAAAHGLFVNEHTLEIDLLRCGRVHSICDTLKALGGKKIQERAAELRANPSGLVPKTYLDDIEAIGKGRFAQRLATTLSRRKYKTCPRYIRKALEYLAAKCSTSPPASPGGGGPAPAES